MRWAGAGTMAEAGRLSAVEDLEAVVEAGRQGVAVGLEDLAVEILGAGEQGEAGEEGQGGTGK